MANVKQRIFGLGFGKTGSTSLARALEELGYSVFDHGSVWYPNLRVRHHVERAVREGKRPLFYLPRIEKLDALTDVRIVALRFEYFDEHYPGSKFILHTRDFEGWWKSRIKHIERGRAEGIAKYRDAPAWQFDKDLWRAKWDEHHAKVYAHFENRPGDLLTVDIPGGEGWSRLANFLGRNEPASEFPRLNTAAPSPQGVRGHLRFQSRKIRGQARRGIQRLRTPQGIDSDPWSL